MSGKSLKELYNILFINYYVSRNTEFLSPAVALYRE